MGCCEKEKSNRYPVANKWPRYDRIPSCWSLLVPFFACFISRFSEVLSSRDARSLIFSCTHFCLISLRPTRLSSMRENVERVKKDVYDLWPTRSRSRWGHQSPRRVAGSLLSPIKHIKRRHEDEAARSPRAVEQRAFRGHFVCRVISLATSHLYVVLKYLCVLHVYGVKGRP